MQESELQLSEAVSMSTSKDHEHAELEKQLIEARENLCQTENRLRVTEEQLLNDRSKGQEETQQMGEQMRAIQESLRNEN